MKCNRGGAALALSLVIACGGTAAAPEDAGSTDVGQNANDAGGPTDGAGSGDGSGPNDSAESDVFVGDPRSDAAPGDGSGGAPVDAATGDGGGDGAIGTATGDGGKGSRCQTNADCGAGLVCYAGSAIRCGVVSGVCVSRLTAACTQSIGGGCLCLDVPAGTCSSGSSYCQGMDTASQCWICQMSQ
jgi:hypothetical protein